MRNIKSYTESLKKEGFQQGLNHDMRDAARMGKIRKVKRLLGEGADVNSAGGLDETALHEATFWGYKNVVKLLIDSGADVNARKSLGETPLHIATKRILPLKHNEEKPEIAKLLIDAGAEVDAKDIDGQTPLHFAAENGQTDIARLLLDRGAEVDARDRDDLTPLMYALRDLSLAFEYRRGYPEIAKMLIISGADPFKAFDGPDKIIKFFKGDLDWMPEGPLKEKLKRMQRGKSAFGL